MEWLNPRVSTTIVISFLVAFCLTFGFGWLLRNKQKSWKPMLGLMLLEYYIFVFCSTVLCRPKCGAAVCKLVPFWNYPDIWNKVDYPADLLELLLNIALFIPIGFLLRGLLGGKIGKALLLGACMSSMIELFQLMLSRGICETNDVLHNTLGCFLGYEALNIVLKNIKR